MLAFCGCSSSGRLVCSSALQAHSVPTAFPPSALPSPAATGLPTRHLANPSPPATNSLLKLCLPCPVAFTLQLGAIAGASSFRPLPPPRIRLQPVQVEFTKLETNHLPAR